MRGKLAKQLRKEAGFVKSYNPKVVRLEEYQAQKSLYKMLKKVHKQ